MMAHKPNNEVHRSVIPPYRDDGLSIRNMGLADP